MKRILLAGLALAAAGLATAPASAQWGPPGGGGYGYGGGYGARGGYRQDFDDDEDERPRYRRGPAYGGEGYGYGRQRPGTICVTARGNCGIARAAPVGTPCGCNIPGFGPKRGAVN
jgi:hypothetical protein